MASTNRDLEDVCEKIISVIPDDDKNKTIFASRMHSILRTYHYAAPEVKIYPWVSMQELLTEFYPIEHKNHNELSKIWNNTN